MFSYPIFVIKTLLMIFFVDRPPLFNCNSFGEFYAIWSRLESGFIHLHAWFSSMMYRHFRAFFVFSIERNFHAAVSLPLSNEAPTLWNRHILCPHYFELFSWHYAVCRKCIYKKLNDEECDHCPVCKIDLGCAPIEKLRYSSPDLIFLGGRHCMKLNFCSVRLFALSNVLLRF